MNLKLFLLFILSFIWYIMQMWYARGHILGYRVQLMQSLVILYTKSLALSFQSLASAFESFIYIFIF